MMMEHATLFGQMKLHYTFKKCIDENVSNANICE